eukprot:TRINITY_DN1429_c1_g2_i1.p1 TRINITY_DN1429_c1_g2~~TRINITY_DN1429_c1_g2_i1.p1  ORF type:complete len:838 (+),score=316.19 TRINITY_DN1429_c1_g2_i1:116-2629(+)
MAAGPRTSATIVDVLRLAEVQSGSADKLRRSLVENGVEPHLMPIMSSEDWADVGVKKVGLRVRLKNAAAQLLGRGDGRPGSMGSSQSAGTQSTQAQRPASSQQSGVPLTTPLQSFRQPGLRRRIGQSLLSRISWRTSRPGSDGVPDVVGLVPPRPRVPSFEDQPEAVRRLYDTDRRSIGLLQELPKGGKAGVLYSLLLGWWVALLYVLMGALLVVTVVAREYGYWLLSTSRFVLSPFGLCLVEVDSTPTRDSAPTEATPLSGGANPLAASTVAAPPTSASCWVFRFTAAPILAAAHFVASAVAWFSVGGMRTSRGSQQLIRLLFADPLRTHISPVLPVAGRSGVVVAFLEAWEWSFFKYSWNGVNVVMLNLLACTPFAFLCKFGGALLGDDFVEDNSIPVMVVCLVAIIPLAYLIGHSVGAISAHTSFVVGAVLNATFGSVIELIIYFISLSKGLNKLVTAATTGALLACMLLLPGLSMLAGGVRHKEQTFNRKAGNVSAVMLLVAVTGLFMPSVYYSVFGAYELNCVSCEINNGTGTFHVVPTHFDDLRDNKTGEFDFSQLTCKSCNYTEHEYRQDKVYVDKVQPLMYSVCGVLIACYGIGLVFTLHTHSHYYDEDKDVEAGLKPDDEEEEEEELQVPTPALDKPERAPKAHAHFGGEPDIVAAPPPAPAHPEWGRTTCVAIMLVGTGCFAMVSEVLVDALKPSLEQMGITEEFGGLTFIALVPCIAEFSNAIQFALQDNIKLSLEIGNIAAIQMILVQLPVLTIGSALMGKHYPSDGFVLVYPQLNLYAVLVSTLILVYLLVDGKCNYFQGISLVAVYVIMVVTFYYVPEGVSDV